jgi:hypothetical protein
MLTNVLALSPLSNSYLCIVTFERELLYRLSIAYIISHLWRRTG